ncbi:MAG TPA: hypothetical protein VGE21_16075 [Flavobacteriales bacterium]
MKALRIAIPVLLLTLITACGGEKAPEPTPDQAHAIEGARRIRTMEDSLFHDSAGFDPRGAHALVDVYLAYAKAHPLDSLAPEFVFRAANVKRSLRDPKGSVALYDRIIRDYGGWAKLEDVYYLKAFIIDTDLQQTGEAEKAYREVIGRFPNGKFAADAQRMIGLLGLTDEQVLERFKQIQDSTEAANAKAGVK